MYVELRNRGRRIGYGQFLVSLYHPVFCRRAGKCACSVAPVMTPSGKLRHEKFPRSLHIDVDESLVVDHNVLHIRAVKDAIALGWLERRPAEPGAVAEPFGVVVGGDSEASASARTPVEIPADRQEAAPRKARVRKE